MTPETGSPLVSICIPVFNNRDFVRQAVGSALNQDYPNIEVVVQDDRSTDGSWEIVEALARQEGRVRPGRNRRNAGMGPNWNIAWLRAAGEYVAMLSADDTLFPGFTRRCIEEFAREPIDVVTTDYCMSRDEPDGSIRVPGRPNRLPHGSSVTFRDFAPLILARNPFGINTTMFRRSAIQAIAKNGRPFSRRVTFDTELFYRIGLSGMALRYVPEPLGWHRLHPGRYSYQHERRLCLDRVLTDLVMAAPLFVRYPRPYLGRLRRSMRMLLDSYSGNSRA